MRERSDDHVLSRQVLWDSPLADITAGRTR